MNDTGQGRDAGDAPLPPPVPADDAGNAKRVAASVRGAKTLAWWAVGVTLFGALCCGGGTVVAGNFLAANADNEERELQRVEQTAVLVKQTSALLGSVADGLRAAGDELPEALPEAPPKDAWGTPVRYRRNPSDATLSSAGPDGRFGSKDDIVLRVAIPK